MSAENTAEGAAPEAAAAPAQQQMVQVEVDDGHVTATYSNFCRVTGSPEELIIDFGLNPQPVGIPTKAIPVTRSGVCALTTAGAETRTLPIPAFVGQVLVLCLNVDGGDCVVTVASAINQAGNNTITLNDIGDTVMLVGVLRSATRAWRLVVNDGATLATV